MSNSRKSQRHVPQTARMSAEQEYELQMRELQLREKDIGSWRTNNATLETALKWLALTIALPLCLHWVVNSWIEKNSPLIGSIVSGCEVPAALMTERAIPEPFPYPENPSIQDQIQWDQDRIAQLKSVMVGMINDRRELREVCGKVGGRKQ